MNNPTNTADAGIVTINIPNMEDPAKEIYGVSIRTEYAARWELMRISTQPRFRFVQDVITRYDTADPLPSAKRQRGYPNLGNDDAENKMP